MIKRLLQKSSNEMMLALDENRSPRRKEEGMELRDRRM